MTKRNAKERLICTRLSRIKYEILRRIKVLDATAQRLLERLREVSIQMRSLQREKEALKTALKVAGIDPEVNPVPEPLGPNDLEYILDVPFENMTLVDTCKKILTDFKGQELTKSQIENYAVMGGCRFNTDDKTNSVAGTLRRLAEEGLCKVTRVKGPHGNKYYL